jgi:hypothetical protein
MAIVRSDDLGDLRARTGRVADAAEGWRRFAVSIRDATDDVDWAIARHSDAWVGATADSLSTHCKALVADLDRASALAHGIAVTLEQAVAIVGSGLEHPFDAGSIDRARAEFGQIARRWLAVADGRAEPFAAPGEVHETGVIVDGDRVVIDTGTADDLVDIGVDPRTGVQSVTVNGYTHLFPSDADIVVRGGPGKDTIAATGVSARLTLLGGEGDDTIHSGDRDAVILGLAGQDRLYGGAGDDRVDGGSGRDYIEAGSGDDIVAGGLGNDTAYGLDGDDALIGGEGQDYLEGADGDDWINANAGDDILSGGTGDDRMVGGAGDDVLYAGRGHDIDEGDLGADTLFGEPTDLATGVERNVEMRVSNLGDFITVDGSPQFRARVEADLELLRSSPDGQQMLAGLAKAHHDTAGGFLFWRHDGDSLTIIEYNDPMQPDNSRASYDGSRVTIAYNPHLDRIHTDGDPASTLDTPPVAVLYHELAHAYDLMNDTTAPDVYTGPDNRGPYRTGVENKEREAVGLPIDGDADPGTPPRIYERHPYALTENGLRDEMGAPHRDQY